MMASSKHYTYAEPIFHGSPANCAVGTPSSSNLAKAAEKLGVRHCPVRLILIMVMVLTYSLKNSSSLLAYFSVYFLKDLSLRSAMSVLVVSRRSRIHPSGNQVIYSKHSRQHHERLGLGVLVLGGTLPLSPVPLLVEPGHLLAMRQRDGMSHLQQVKVGVTEAGDISMRYLMWCEYSRCGGE